MLKPFYCLLFILLLTTFLGACNKLPQLGPATENDLASASQADCGYVQNSYGQRISWKNGLPIHLYLHPNFPAEFEQPLRDAAKKWEDAAGLSLFTFDRAPNGTSDTPAFDYKNIIYYLSDWDDAQKSMQAVTTLKWQQNTITDSDIKIDAHFYNFYASSPHSSYDIHMQSLMIHELGHVLGLKHKTVAPTVMWATLSGNTLREELSATDIASLKCEY